MCVAVCTMTNFYRTEWRKKVSLVYNWNSRIEHSAQMSVRIHAQCSGSFVSKHKYCFHYILTLATLTFDIVKWTNSNSGCELFLSQHIFFIQTYLSFLFNSKIHFHGNILTMGLNSLFTLIWMYESMVRVFGQMNFLRDWTHCRLDFLLRCSIRRLNFQLFASAFVHQFEICVVVKPPAASLSMACLRILSVKFQKLKMKN